MSINMGSPNFIVVDGIDGVGKSTIVCGIEDYLLNKSKKPNIVHVVESTFLSSEVKRYLKSNDVKQTSATTLGFLFCAAINDVIERIIIPSMAAKEIIICDRYTLSTRVYQENSHYIDTMCNIIDSTLMPDITFILDAPPEIIRERMLARTDDGDITETIDVDIVNHRRMAYVAQARRLGANAYLIDASCDVNTVLGKIYKILDTYY